ncbi:unnamed protein product, partial [Rotaria magnacalcarata]
ELLHDGLHPAPLLTEGIWKCLARAVKPIEESLLDPVPSLAKLSVKERLSFSTATIKPIGKAPPKWKGKGKGKSSRSTPYSTGSQVGVAAPSAGQHSRQTIAYEATPPYYGPPMRQPFPAYPPHPACSSTGSSYVSPSAYYSPSQYYPPASNFASSSKPLPPKMPHIEELEEATDTYGNISWRPIPAEPISEIGTINYSAPIAWSRQSHEAEVQRIMGRCHLASIAQQCMFREQTALILQERALVEMRRGLNASMNVASSTLAHRALNHLSDPPPQFQHLHENLRDLMPPPASQNQFGIYPPSASYHQYPAHPPPAAHQQYPAYPPP